MLRADINLFQRRDEGYLAEKYGLDIDIYLFDLIKQPFFMLDALDQAYQV